VDEEKLADLFKAAVADPPPASFTEHDIATKSQQVTRQRRAALAGGGGLAVVILVVGLLLGTGVFGHTSGSGTLAGGSAGGAQRPSDGSFGNVVPGLASGNAGPNAISPTHFPGSTPKQGGGENGGVGSDAGGTHAGCGPTDRQLAVALANELPSVGAPVATPAALACIPGTRTASYHVHVGGSPDGYITALLVPVNAPTLFSDHAKGTSGDTGPARSGEWTVVVLSQPTGGATSGPVANQIAGIQKALAAKF
jgi:hypothetical protein